MQPQYVWIVHNNCSRECFHCFCNPLPKDNIVTTARLTRELEQHGINYRIYATAQMDNRLKDIYDKINVNDLIGGHELNLEMIQQRDDVNLIFFSLHGPDKKSHEAIAHKEDFNAVVSCIKKVQQSKKLNAGIFCVIHGYNYLLLEKMCQFASDIGVSKIIFLKLSHAGRAKTLPAEHYMDQEKTIHWLKNYHEIKYQYGSMQMGLIENWGPQYSKLRKLFYGVFGNFYPNFFCKCGNEHIALKSSSKELFPCKFTMTAPELKIGHFDSEKGLIITDNWYRNLKEKIGEPCNSCSIFKICRGGCRAEAIFNKRHREGIMDRYAGFPNCPVALGITKWIDFKEDINFFAGLINRLIRGKKEPDWKLWN